jgi:RNA polymerase-binding transcription factor DksA
MHYHYFTLEQRSALERIVSDFSDEQVKQAALRRMHSPEYGVCEACGADIPFVRLVADPLRKRCASCEV